uniref:Uncharacterized protein n=1 Tax=Tetraselmis sp. GSL018 TaxID=582737 RepID=A0A061SAM5_9CHLO
MNSSSSYETKTETISFMHHNFYVCCYELYGILSALCDRSKETLSVPSCRRIICCSIFTQDKLGRRTFPRQSSPAGLPYSLLKQFGKQSSVFRDQTSLLERFLDHALRCCCTRWFLA